MNEMLEKIKIWMRAMERADQTIIKVLGKIGKALEEIELRLETLENKPCRHDKVDPNENRD